MPRSTDPVVLDDWHAIGRIEDMPRNTKLLGQEISARRDDGGRVRVFAGSDERPAQIRYGHVWTTLGTPARDLVDMPEFDEPNRRLVTCGIVTVRTSPLRIVENFLDLAHFPYVHNEILGTEARGEVETYKVELRQPEDEIWATECRFFQPQAAKSAEGGQMSEYMYRVPAPFITILYKTCPVVEGAWDLIGLFIQPLDETTCDVHSFVLVIDETSTDNDLLHFQQLIFLQDRSILENQVPALMPLDPGREYAIRADGSSMVYRRWLRDKGLRFGVLPEGVAL
jgi:phenylpropionate dioxygenase-like ring-hydroxylating dioxygenase large terminal subunit